MTSLYDWTDCWTPRANVPFTQAVSHGAWTNVPQARNASSRQRSSLKSVTKMRHTDVSVLT